MQIRKLSDDMLTRRNPFPNNIRESKVMIFVDGENLAIRYNKMLGNNNPFNHVNHLANVFVWSHFLNFKTHKACEIIRKYYYTSIKGSADKIDEITDNLKSIGIEAPRVFKKSKTRGSKRVDISLSADMLTISSRKNYDVAVLVAGDEDYVPLVDAVMGEGRRVCLWFLEKGLSPLLKNRVDHFYRLEHILFDENASRYYS